MATKFVNAWDNTDRTENGAATFKSTLNPHLDLFSKAGAMRNDQVAVEKLFAKAYAEDKVLAAKIAFYLRDVRQGQGERLSFRTMLAYMYKHDVKAFEKVAPLVAEYGRWDDVVVYVDNRVVVNLVRNQLREDNKTEYPSLLGKWMPSENASSDKTVKLARKWINVLGLSAPGYRTILSSLRRKINIVERLMSANEFSAIEYAKVPSKAMTNYRKAFGKQDTTRFGEYLSAVEKGTKKINAGVLYPYEIYNKVNASYGVDRTLEAQWKALPNYMVGDKKALVMADVSGSMAGDPMAVSVSSALYAAERMTGPFANHFMTFSGSPELVKVTGNTLKEKMENISRANWNQNTNVQAAFDKILQVAKRNNLAQSDLPDVLLIISDMEFDVADRTKTNFQVIRDKFAASGYVMPTLVFWNVRARAGNSPVTEREYGVFLVSGLSPVIFKSALTAKATNPVELMLEVINSERYAAIETALA